MGLNLETLKELQTRVVREMQFRGHSEYAEDASQEYVIKFLEGRADRQPIEFFCTDYLRKYHKKRSSFEYSFVDIPNYSLECIHSNDPTIKMENTIDYRSIIEKIDNIKSSRQRRYLYLYFFSDVSVIQISKREQLSEGTVYQELQAGIAALKKLIL